MATYKKKTGHQSPEKAEAARLALVAMVEDIHYSTDASYSANATVYADHQIPFVDKHMEYLRVHPGIDPDQYIANLRLMTRVKS